MRYIIFLLITAVYLNAVDGTIIDAVTLKPINNALVQDSKKTVHTDPSGVFRLRTNEKTLHVKAYGYRPYSIESNTTKKTFALQPIRVKALYLTFWGASNNSKTFKNALELIEKTDLNAIVVDMKNEYGSTLFWTGFEQANSYGAHLNRTNRNIHKFIKTLKSRGIYTIARIATFKDDLQATNNYDYAIKKNDANLSVWRNHDNMAWVDPFDKRSHKYNIEIAKEAAKVGFDEINFDYIRFPAKKGLVCSRPSTQESRIKAISDFLDEAKSALQSFGVFISVDIYGNVCWAKNDNGIGQTIESLAKHVDYLCPMLYPSGFNYGSFSRKYPAKYPYIAVYRSIKHIENIIKPQRIRPWLQYFKDYTRARVEYNREQIQEQIKATDDMQTNGWMLWSPSSKYNIKDIVTDLNATQF